MIGFIGCGNMATAMIKGLISNQQYKGEEIAVFDIDTKKVDELSQAFSVVKAESENDIVPKCDVIVLAVKPNIIPEVLYKIGDNLKVYDPLIISIAAGKTTDFIESYLPYEPRLVRIMPNINATCGSSVSAYCGNSRIRQDIKHGKLDLATARSFCNSFGVSFELEEHQFSIFSAMASCSPAFVFMFIDSLARAGVKYGIPRDKALEIARIAVQGSAVMMGQSDKHPYALVDSVCSPGGTTIEGVCTLKELGFETAVEKAVEASYNKDRRL